MNPVYMDIPGLESFLHYAGPYAVFTSDTGMHYVYSCPQCVTEDNDFATFYYSPIVEVDSFLPPPTNPVPEPSTYLLLAAALLFLSLRAKLRRG